MLACQAGCYPGVCALIAFGADPDPVNQDGATAMWQLNEKIDKTEKRKIKKVIWKAKLRWLCQNKVRLMKVAYSMWEKFG